MITEKRNCIICNEEYIAKNWRSQVCSHECHLIRRREWHKVNGDRIRQKERERYHNGGKAYYKQYEQTKRGFLMRKYRNMQSRIKGIQKSKFHLYKDITGEKLLDRNTFYRWALNSKEFHELYKTWVESNYKRKLSPSVDRVDSSKGYILENMEWVTHSENSRRGSISHWSKKQVKI